MGSVLLVDRTIAEALERWLLAGTGFYSGRKRKIFEGASKSGSSVS